MEYPDYDMCGWNSELINQEHCILRVHGTIKHKLQKARKFHNAFFQQLHLNIQKNAVKKTLNLKKKPLANMITAMTL